MTDPAPASITDEAQAADDSSLREAMNRVRLEVGKAVVGQDGAVTGLLIALLARGHVLLEGVPGVAKTLLVRAFSRALGLDTKRIQFTPDLMPGDVTGLARVRRPDGGVRVPRRARSSRTSCWPTRSTGLRPRPRPRSWRRWRSGRSPPTA